MITLPPYIHERDAYHQFPIRDRWIFNKLTLAERLGYQCGPIGTRPSSRLDVIVRPQMNLYGMGRGGFYQYGQWPFAAWDQAPNANPGYFWCERFVGKHGYTTYIDDVPFSEDVADYTEIRAGTRWDGVMDGTFIGPALPAMLQGLSRYLMLEWIDGKIIEVTPRFTPNSARRYVLDDYKAINPTHVPDNDIKFGHVDMRMVPDPAGGFAWEEDETTRRPYPDRN